MGKQIKVVSTIFLIFTAFGFYACKTDLMYTESKTIDKNGWLKSDTLVFAPQIEKTDEVYNIYLWVRHSKNYKFSNIWVKVISNPQVTNDSTGLVEIKIADKLGVWTGDCSQSLCTNRILLKENYQFKYSGAFKVEVLQYMREDVLTAIKNVGFEMELVKK